MPTTPRQQPKRGWARRSAACAASLGLCLAVILAGCAGLPGSGHTPAAGPSGTGGQTPSANGTATSSESSTATPAPSRGPTTAPTTRQPSAPSSQTPSAAATGFPNAATTGVPAGTGLTDYTGPCTITQAGAVIDAKRIGCSLEIRAKGVAITRSVVAGTVYADPDTGAGSFTIADSRVEVGSVAGTGIGDGFFTARRVEVTGGNRSINCYLNCTVEDSYVHGQFRDATGRAHESGIRMGSGSVIRGNTIACDAPDVPPDAGCSAALTGYGDFDTVQNNLIQANLFVGGSGGFCAYGGSSRGKPFSAGTNHIRFLDNVFQRGASGKCGFYGPVTAFDPAAAGNVWTNNRYTDGTPIAGD